MTPDMPERFTLARQDQTWSQSLLSGSMTHGFFPISIRKLRKQLDIAQRASMMRIAMVGTRAPHFSLLCTDGSGSGRRQVSLDDYLDRWLLLLFYSRDFSFI
jgi:hypothetical protein